MSTISEELAIAIQHHQAGRLQAAEQIYRRVLAAEPTQPDAWHLLGVVNAQGGNHKLAVEHIRRALTARPDWAEAQVNLGNALREQGKLDEALPVLRRAVQLKPELAEAHCSLGAVFKNQGNLAEAVACYRWALELKPDYAEAHGNLGSALEEAGDLEEAEASFRAALRHNPRFAFAHYKLAGLLAGKLPEEDLAVQRRLLQQGSASGEPRGPTDEEGMLLHFGLARVLDARGEYDEAARHLAGATPCNWPIRRRRGRVYDPQEHEFLVTQMIEACTPDFFRRVRGFGLESEIPVFVVGLPRSGTTLIEQILAGHSRVFAAGEIKLAGETLAALGGQGADSIEGLRQLDRETARRLASWHLERLRALSPAALRIVDKLPDNYFSLGLLASLFPRAKFILCRRDLRDVALSCWMTHFREIRWASDQGQIASRFHQYRRLMEHWRKVLPAPLLEVDYEEIVADPQGLARRLVGWCGLDWEPGCGISPGETAGRHGQRRPGAPAGLPHIGGKMEALRTVSRFAVRPAGKRLTQRGQPLKSEPVPGWGWRRLGHLRRPPLWGKGCPPPP